MSVFRKIYLVVFTTLCAYNSTAQSGNEEILTKADSLLLVKYRNEVIRSQGSEEDSTSTEEDIQASWGNSRIDYGVIKYAPDNSFKIITFIFESCGAYCNSEWYSWIHYNLKGKEQVRKIHCGSIDTIYQLPGKKYLIIDRYGSRPAGVLTVDCMSTYLISFEGDSLITYPIEYRGKQSFEFCQENGVDIDNDHYIRYDSVSKMLSYHYANNFAYSNELDLDTIRQGQFIFINGSFILEKETIRAQDNRILPVKSNEWTENYKIRSTDTVNIHIGMLDTNQFVYDCIGCDESFSNVIKVSVISNDLKKKLFDLPTNGAYLEKIVVMNLQGNNFIYVTTYETSGNSDGYLYYLNPASLTVSKVIVEQSKSNLPKGCEPWGSYSYLSIDEKTQEISSSSQFIDTTAENRRGSVIKSYKMEKLKDDQFIIKEVKDEVHFEE
jgi:hypothetical protein